LPKPTKLEATGTFEAARAHKAALEAIGAHAWFVSLEDGPV
jgi:hypothetical protein